MPECPLHSQGFPDPSVFNWTATYRRDSTVVTPYERWEYYNQSVRFQSQTRNYAANKTHQVAWFVSNCGARLGWGLEKGCFLTSEYMNQEWSSSVRDGVRKIHFGGHLRLLWNTEMPKKFVRQLFSDAFETVQVLFGLWKLQLSRLHHRKVLCKQSEVITRADKLFASKLTAEKIYYIRVLSAILSCP